ncbi:homoserine dehydrogenase [Oceanobacillus sp. CAU 1775]
MEKKISIGLLGLGVVGSGVINIINNHQEKLAHQLGTSVEVKRILVRDIEKARDINGSEDILTLNADDILNDPEIDVVVEVIGGIDQAKAYILKAFAAKKHVITANKDLVALHGPELHAAAEKNNCDFYYEASVAGGIPIIRGIKDGLSSDRITRIIGIVNGTTNYILTKMDEDGMSYEAALAEAQELGFAEADPTADVEGLDAARKMAILGRLAFSTPVDLDDVQVTGISNVSSEDIKNGNDLGYTMKLVGYADFSNQKLEIHVLPTFISNNHPLASVKNEYNAVYVYGKAVGETMFYGPGAGSLPTATAIVSDLVATIKNIRLGVTGEQYVSNRFAKSLKPASERFSQYYMRLKVKDEAGVFSELTKLFHKYEISLKRIVQHPIEKNKSAEIIFITHHTTEEHFTNLIEKLGKLPIVHEISSYYRVEGDGEE